MINRKDANQKVIIDCLKKLGYSVLELDDVKNGCPDILVGKNGNNYLIEIKTEKGKLNELQQKFIERWNTRVYIIKNIDEAIEFDNLN